MTKSYVCIIFSCHNFPDQTIMSELIHYSAIFAITFTYCTCINVVVVVVVVLIIVIIIILAA